MAGDKLNRRRFIIGTGAATVAGAQSLTTLPTHAREQPDTTGSKHTDPATDASRSGAQIVIAVVEGGASLALIDAAGCLADRLNRTGRFSPRVRVDPVHRPGTASCGSADILIATADFAQAIAPAVALLGGQPCPVRRGPSKLTDIAQAIWDERLSDAGYKPLPIGHIPGGADMIGVTDAGRDPAPIAACGVTHMALNRLQRPAVHLGSTKRPTVVAGLDIVAAQPVLPDGRQRFARPMSGKPMTGPLVAAYIRLDLWEALDSQHRAAVIAAAASQIDRSVADDTFISRHIRPVFMADLITNPADGITQPFDDAVGASLSALAQNDAEAFRAFSTHC